LGKSEEDNSFIKGVKNTEHRFNGVNSLGPEELKKICRGEREREKKPSKKGYQKGRGDSSSKHLGIVVPHVLHK